MGTNCYKSPLTSNILMELILKCDERIIPSLVELYIAEYGTRNVGSYLGRLLAMSNMLAREAYERTCSWTVIV